MEEYIENGVRLGWLIDSLGPSRRRVYVYRPGTDSGDSGAPRRHISGEPELPGFVLDLTTHLGAGFLTGPIRPHPNPLH